MAIHSGYWAVLKEIFKIEAHIEHNFIASSEVDVQLQGGQI